MSNIQKVDSVHELSSKVAEGYIYSMESIMDIFNLSKTKYYDHIYNNVNIVKVPKKVRKNINYKELEGLTAYDRSNMERIKLLDESALLQAEEVHEYLLDNKLMFFEFYDIETQGYYKLSEEVVRAYGSYISSVVVKAKTRKELASIGQAGREFSSNDHTNKSRFHAGIKNYNHIRVVILGIYSYYILDKDDGKDNLDKIFYNELKRQSIIKDNLNFFHIDQIIGK